MTSFLRISEKKWFLRLTGMFYFFLRKTLCSLIFLFGCSKLNLTSNYALNMILLWQLLIIWERPEGKSLLPFLLSLFSHIKFNIIICLNLMRSGGRENCGWLLGFGSNTKVIGCDCKSLFILQFRSLYFTEKKHAHCSLLGNS